MANLKQAARCAMADLIGVYQKSELDEAGLRSIVEVHDALVAEGENLSDYSKDISSVKRDLLNIKRETRTETAGLVPVYSSGHQPPHKENTMPKEFTEADVTREHIYTTDHRTDLHDTPLWWHTQGLTQTATGYGKKLTTNWKISFCGKLYRIYATCFSNAASHWFTIKGRKIHIS